MSKWSRYPGDRSYLKDHPHMAPDLICKLCGGIYDEDEPGDESLKGYCSELCESTDRKIDEKEIKREEREEA